MTDVQSKYNVVKLRFALAVWKKTLMHSEYAPPSTEHASPKNTAHRLRADEP